MINKVEATILAGCHLV